MAALTAEERARSGTLDRWSAKDTLAHIAVWKSRLAEELGAARQGEQVERIAEFDAENARIFEAHRSYTWEEIVDLLELAHRELPEQVGALSEEELASAGFFLRQDERSLWRVIVGSSFNHSYIHLAEYYRQQGDLSQSGAYIGEMAQAVIGLDDSPQWQGTVRYNLACHHALVGRKAEAIAELRAALALQPELGAWSQEDADLESLHGEPAYRAIYEDRA